MSNRPVYYVVAITALSLVGLIAACVGNDPDTADTIVIQNKNDGGSSTSSGSSGISSSSASSSGGNEEDAGSSSSSGDIDGGSGSVACDLETCPRPGNTCCVTEDAGRSCRLEGECTAFGARAFDCDSRNDCLPGWWCCAATNGGTYESTCRESEIASGIECPALILCRTNADCSTRSPGPGSCIGDLGNGFRYCQ